MSADPPTPHRRAELSTSVRSLVWVLAGDVDEAWRALAAQHVVERFDDGDALLKRLAHGERPDLLVLDWESSGPEVGRAVRKRHDASSLPILALTASAVASDALVEALTALVNDFMPRPFHPAELRARVQALLSARALHQRALHAEHDRADLLDAQHEEAVVRERIMAILGHDIRSPLGAMLMGNKLLRPKLADDAESAHLLDIQLRSCRRLERMTLGLLEVARCRQPSGLVLSRGVVDLHSLCENVAREAETTHANRDIRRVFEGNGRGEWDSERVEQVVANLVSNALLYSPPSTPVGVTCRDDGDAVLLGVHNHGAPIPERERATLFTPFRRGYLKPTARGPKGLGLGLYLVDQIARAHGATVSVRSTDSEGTTFSVRWPRTAPRSASQP